MEEYYHASVEPSYLYLHNRFIQYAHARCLADELEMLGVTGRRVAPSNISWPEGFKDVFDFSYPGSPSARPREFDAIALIGADQPHYNYPMRNVSEVVFRVVHGKGGPAGRSSVGDLSLQQAIREAFPGAIYLHMGRGYRVHEWQNNRLERTIRVSPTGTHASPRPLMRTFVNLSLDREGIVDQHLRLGDNGFLSECHLQVVERVEGVREGEKRKYYKDLRQERPAMTSKTREFRTTGVVMSIDETWFTQKGVKQRVANAFRELMLREYSIAAQDVDSVATNISLIRGDGRYEPSFQHDSYIRCYSRESASDRTCIPPIRTSSQSISVGRESVIRGCPSFQRYYRWLARLVCTALR